MNTLLTLHSSFDAHTSVFSSKYSLSSLFRLQNILSQTLSNNFGWFTYCRKLEPNMAFVWWHLVWKMIVLFVILGTLSSFGPPASTSIFGKCVGSRKRLCNFSNLCSKSWKKEWLNEILLIGYRYVRAGLHNSRQSRSCNDKVVPNYFPDLTEYR